MYIRTIPILIMKYYPVKLSEPSRVGITINWLVEKGYIGNDNSKN